MELYFSPPMECSRGIEPRLAVSKTAVPSVTPAGPNITPTWSRTRTWTLGESNAIRYTIGTFKSRRLDSHQHEAVYKTAAFLFRATSAKSRSAPIRTVSSAFGGSLLSQEHTPVENHFAALMSAESHAAITIDTPER